MDLSLIKVFLIILLDVFFLLLDDGLAAQLGKRKKLDEHAKKLELQFYKHFKDKQLFGNVIRENKTLQIQLCLLLWSRPNEVDALCVSNRTIGHKSIHFLKTTSHDIPLDIVTCTCWDLLGQYQDGDHENFHVTKVSSTEYYVLDDYNKDLETLILRTYVPNITLSLDEAMINQ